MRQNRWNRQKSIRLLEITYINVRDKIIIYND